MKEEKKIDKLYAVKVVICSATIIICVLGLFKVIPANIAIPAALAVLSVLMGVFESIRDFRRGKKGWMWFDVISGVVLLAFVIVNLKNMI